MQRYLAQLAMTLALSRPRMLITTGPNDIESAVKTILYHAFTILINDVQALVRKHVECSIKLLLADRDPVVSAHAKDRQSALKRWLKNANPLSWSDEGRPGGNYALLSIMLCSDPHSDHPLLSLSKQPVTYDAFAQLLLLFISKVNQPRPAPLSSKGGFQHVLFIAYRMVRRLVPSGNDKDIYWTNHFIEMLKKMEVHLLPWHKDSPKAYAIDSSLSSWTSLRVIKNMPSSSTKTFVDRVFDQAASVANSDPDAPWDIPSRLCDMKLLWSKKRLPACWNIQLASLNAASSDSAHVYQAYQYVEQHYDGGYWSHHFALIVAICFSRVVPNICFDQSAHVTSKDSRGATDEIRAFDWIPTQSASRKGTVAPLPFIVMMSTALVSFWDKKSPFSTYLLDHNYVLGKQWTDKHGRYHLLSILS